MIKSMNTAEQAMKMQQTRIDTLANNLANVNSAGFRQVLTRVAEAGAEDVAIDEERMAAGNPRGDKNLNAWSSDTDLVLSQATDMRRGAIMSTGRDTDLAIMGEGFFVVQTEAGERFTRAGSFTLDNQNRLVTPEGNPVLGDGGAITIAGDDFSIDQNGNVIVDGAAAGRVRLVNFGDPHRLEHEGNNLLRPPAGLEPQDLPPAEIVISQGHVEGSNVNAIDTLVAMISAQRAFEIQQKTLTTEDEMLAQAVSKLPRNSG